MKKFWGRFFVLFAITILAASLAAQPPTENVDPGSGGAGGGGCSICRMYQSGSYISLACGSPASGGWGYQFCRMESYEQETYCFVDGNQCCVD